MDSGQMNRLMSYRASQTKQQQAETVAAKEHQQRQAVADKWSNYREQVGRELPPHAADLATMQAQLGDMKSGAANVSYGDNHLGSADRLVKQKAMGYMPTVKDDAGNKIDTSCFMRLDDKGNPSFYRGVDASYNEVLEKTGQKKLETGKSYMQNGRPMKFSDSMGQERQNMAFEPMSREDYQKMTYATDDDINKQVDRVRDMQSSGKIPKDGFVPMAEQPYVGDHTTSAAATQSIQNTVKKLDGTDFDQKDGHGDFMMDKFRSCDTKDCTQTSAEMTTPGMQRGLIKDMDQMNSQMANQQNQQDAVNYEQLLQQALQEMQQRNAKQREEDDEPSFMRSFMQSYMQTMAMMKMYNMYKQAYGSPSQPAYDKTAFAGVQQDMMNQIQQSGKFSADMAKDLYESDKALSKFTTLDMSQDYTPEQEAQPGIEQSVSKNMVYDEKTDMYREATAAESDSPEAELEEPGPEEPQSAGMESEADAGQLEEIREAGPEEDAGVADTPVPDAETETTETEPAAPQQSVRQLPDALQSSVAGFDANYTSPRGVPDGMGNIGLGNSGMEMDNGMEM